MGPILMSSQRIYYGIKASELAPRLIRVQKSGSLSADISSSTEENYQLFPSSETGRKILSS